MANHAALIRQENAGKPVVQRGRNFIEFDIGDGTKQRVFTIDKLHYSATEDHEVDTTWITSVDPAWQWQLLENDFHVHARNLLNAGDLIQWLDTRSGQSVIVDPQSINWVDNVTDSRQQISTKQAVGATTEDAKITWVNGYGTGRHFRYTAHPKRLIKHVIIDSLANLPAPTVNNPYFEIEFVIKKSSGVTLYVDGQPWDNSTKTTTANRIDFRLTDGTVAWYFQAPIAEDSAGETCPGIFQLRRQGNTRFCTVRFPKAWIDAAVFPIYVDDTFTDGYGGDVTTYCDTYVNESSASTTYGSAATMFMFSNATQRRNILLKFDLSSLSGVTISSAILSLYNNIQWEANRDYSLHSILSANSSWDEATARWSLALDADPDIYWEGDAASDGGTDAGCSVSGTDYNATAIGTFSYTASTAAGTEHQVTLNTTQVTAWLTANYGLVGILTTPNIAANEPWATSDNATTARRPKLVVTYTAAGIATSEATQAQTSDAVSIVAISPIVPAEATQAQASDAASIIAIYTVIPAEATQAQSSDAAMLGQFTPIAPAEATQVQASDTASIVAIYPVAPAEATQSQTSDAAILSEGAINITPAEASQAQTSDAAAIANLYSYTDGSGGDVNTAQDVNLHSTAHTFNNGLHDAVQFGSYNYGLIQFNLSAVPASGTIVSAKLYLGLYDGGGNADIYAVLAANGGWIEGTGDFDLALEGEPCWDAKEADGSGGIKTAWAGGTSGCGVAGTDISASPIGTLTAGSAGIYEIELNSGTVQGWFGASNTNYGILIKPTSTNSYHFALSEYTTADYRPKLEVLYTSIDSFTLVTPSDNTQAQTSDAVTLAAVYPIAPAEALQAQTSDEVSLSYFAPGTDITPAEATQSQTTDDTTLSIIYIVSVADATQAQASDLAVITTPVVAYPPGQRRLLEPDQRANAEMAVRATSVLGTRATLEVDD